MGGRLPGAGIGGVMGYPRRLDDIAYDVHTLMRERGMYRHATITFVDPVLGDVEGRKPNPSFDAERLAFIHSEVSEALDALRDGDEDALALELADIVLRTLDFAAWKGINIDSAVSRKLTEVAQRHDQRPASPAAAAEAVRDA